jgi:hypothetical protein
MLSEVVIQELMYGREERRRSKVRRKMNVRGQERYLVFNALANAKARSVECKTEESRVRAHQLTKFGGKEKVVAAKGGNAGQMKILC